MNFFTAFAIALVSIKCQCRCVDGIILMSSLILQDVTQVFYLEPGCICQSVTVHMSWS